MIITVRAKTASRKASIVKIGDLTYTVSVIAPASKGLANMAIRKVLCDHFDLPPSRVSLIRGFKSTVKIFEVYE